MFWGDKEIRITHSMNYKELQKSLEKCPLCKVFDMYISGFEPKLRTWKHDSIFIRRSNSCSEGAIYLEWESSRWYRSPPPKRLRIRYPGGQKPLPTLYKFGSRESLGLTNQWINHCLTYHHDCPKRDPSFLPSRLIKVNEGVNVRLVSTSGMLTDDKKTTRYTTLSYCWGYDPNPRGLTRRSNLKERLKRIKLNSLPWTIKDAIIITKGLGVAYLWVDALCIIQDDDRDWQQESALMAEIYSNSYCTIAASSAVANDDGFIGKPLVWRNACLLEWESSGMQNQNSVVIYPQETTAKDIKETLISCPLSKRGWVLQEMCLSPRVIHHTDNGLVWICKQMHTSEQQHKLGEQPIDTTLSRELPYPILQLCKPYEDWREYIEDYSRRSLTRITDRLPALAGVAMRMHRETGATYLAGIWKESLMQDLIWYRLPEDPPLVICSPYIAPSWSWASKQGMLHCNYRHSFLMIPYSGDESTDSRTSTKIIREIQDPAFRHGDDEEDCYRTFVKHVIGTFRLLKAEVEIKGQNPFGEVTSGFLQIEGKFKAVHTILRDHKENVFAYPDFHSRNFQYGLWKFREECGDNSLAIGKWTPDCEMEDNGESFVLYFLRITPKCVGLVLRAVKKKPNTFERVGLGMVTRKFVKILNFHIVTIV
ncbi:HET-domain-containing protein [Daldinia eschscholtzii]|nr:HET-domain-containing protein [Daldinia eschscholtzii]